MADWARRTAILTSRPILCPGVRIVVGVRMGLAYVAAERHFTGPLAPTSQSGWPVRVKVRGCGGQKKDGTRAKAILRGFAAIFSATGIKTGALVF